jgi:exodeoxyribonuclease V alpha subunit
MTAPIDDRANPTGTQPARHFGEQLGRLCAQRAKAGAAAVQAAAVAVADALAEGHACVPLHSLGGDRDQLRALLRDSGVVGDGRPGGPLLPLVLDAGDRLWLLRLFAAEQRLAAALRARLQAPPLAVPDATLQALRELPRDADGGDPDWQAIAVAAAVRSSFTVITGGPGTGKTHTIGKLLSVLRAGQPSLRVALAAPTGKASARLGEAIAGVVADAPAPTTLHRLLEYLSVEDLFRRGPDRPLPHDLVVVDEASMVDLELMAALFAALLPSARLVLLGDRDQLTSVGTGQVLADLCRAAHQVVGARSGVGSGVGLALAAFCREHLGQALLVAQSPVAQSPTALADHVVVLRKNHRFGTQPGIGAFAAAVADRDAGRALAALRAGHADLRLLPHGEPRARVAAIWPALTSVFDADGPAAALAALLRGRILCATRHGPFGVEATNRFVEQALRDEGRRIDGVHHGLHYHGRPVLVTANDHDNRLYNGDLGVEWREPDGTLLAWFGDGKGRMRSVPLLRLPPHETAWAMTVHKSQGSEFDEVLLLLPDRAGPLLHSQLVYTAVTRARRRAVIAGDEALLAQALATEPVRSTGLGDLLAE